MISSDLIGIKLSKFSREIVFRQIVSLHETPGEPTKTGNCCEAPEEFLVLVGCISSVPIMEGSKNNVGPEGAPNEPPVPDLGNRINLKDPRMARTGRKHPPRHCL